MCRVPRGGAEAVGGLTAALRCTPKNDNPLHTHAHTHMTGPACKDSRAAAQVGLPCAHARATPRPPPTHLWRRLLCTCTQRSIGSAELWQGLLKPYTLNPNHPTLSRLPHEGASAAAEASLSRFHLVCPGSSAELLAALRCLPRNVAQLQASPGGMALLLVDNVDAFYWMDRAAGPSPHAGVDGDVQGCARAACWGALRVGGVGMGQVDWDKVISPSLSLAAWPPDEWQCLSALLALHKDVDTPLKT